MINLELAKKHQETFGQVMMLAEHMMRPYSRKYDKEEHTYPKEMEEVAKLIGGARSAATGGTTRAHPRRHRGQRRQHGRRGRPVRPVLG